VYTSIFGSYAVYAFIRTGSVAAVTISHAYCNWMGLPDLSFMNILNPMHQYRTILLMAYVIGALAFKWYFTVDILLPLPSVLTEMVIYQGLEASE
jgi:prenyl protein peptidase